VLDDLARTLEVEPGKLEQAPELDAPYLRDVLFRTHDEGEEACALSGRPANELETRPRVGGEPAHDDLTRAGREGRAVCDIARPGARHLDEQPVLGGRRGGPERLPGCEREVRAAVGHASCSSRMTQMSCPCPTCCPATTASSETTPLLCAAISFSIFIASTTQMTRPASMTSPSPTSTSSTVPCMGLTTASVAAPDNPFRRARWRRASSAHGGTGEFSRTSCRRPSSSMLSVRTFVPRDPSDRAAIVVFQ